MDIHGAAPPMTAHLELGCFGYRPELGQLMRRGRWCQTYAQDPRAKRRAAQQDIRGVRHDYEDDGGESALGARVGCIFNRSKHRRGSLGWHLLCVGIATSRRSKQPDWQAERCSASMAGAGNDADPCSPW